MDLDRDGIGGAVAGDGGGAVGFGIAELRLQGDVGGADVFTIDAGADQRVDDRLLTVIGLVHRGGDVGRGEFDADVGGQGVRNTLHLARPDDGDLTRIGAGRAGRAVGIAR